VIDHRRDSRLARQHHHAHECTTNAQREIVLNIIVGIVGALLAGLLLTPLFGIGTINQSNFSLPALLISLLGAVILLAIVNLVRRGTVR
jgi:uncharacterized membrane protein YeaQ/YmgE (transglycosylase-associated protein family)